MNNKKRNAVIASIAALLFTAPIVVFSVAYYSSRKTNAFKPAKVDIEVVENNDGGAEFSKELTLEDGKTDKAVQIRDTRSKEGEMLRVFFVPMWYEKTENGAGNLCGGVFDLRPNNISQTGNTLVYEDGENKITLHLNDDWETNGWSYGGDGYFYYKGELQSGKLTPQLLDKVEMNDGAQALLTDHVFRLDVLADAIQTSGGASSERDWETDNANPAP